MNRFLFSFLLIFSAVMSLRAQTDPADRITGTWITKDKRGKVEVYRSGNMYYGKMIGGKSLEDEYGQAKKDVKNPDPALRDRSIKDLVILSNLKYNGDKWDGGKIYDPGSGKTYSASARFKGDKLELRGYIGMAMFGKTKVMERVE